MVHATGLLLVLGLAAPAQAKAQAPVSVRAEARVVAVQRAGLLAASPGEATARLLGADLADAAWSGGPDAWARAVAARIGAPDHAVTRAALFVLAAPVQVDVGPNRMRVMVRVPLP